MERGATPDPQVAGLAELHERGVAQLGRQRLDGLPDPATVEADVPRLVHRERLAERSDIERDEAVEAFGDVAPEGPRPAPLPQAANRVGMRDGDQHDASLRGDQARDAESRCRGRQLERPLAVGLPAVQAARRVEPHRASLGAPQPRNDDAREGRRRDDLRQPPVVVQIQHGVGKVAHQEQEAPVVERGDAGDGLLGPRDEQRHGAQASRVPAEQPAVDHDQHAAPRIGDDHVGAPRRHLLARGDGVPREAVEPRDARVRGGPGRADARLHDVDDDVERQAGLGRELGPAPGVAVRRLPVNERGEPDQTGRERHGHPPRLRTIAHDANIDAAPAARGAMRYGCCGVPAVRSGAAGRAWAANW